MEKAVRVISIALRFFHDDLELPTAGRNAVRRSCGRNSIPISLDTSNCEEFPLLADRVLIWSTKFVRLDEWRARWTMTRGLEERQILAKAVFVEGHADGGVHAHFLEGGDLVCCGDAAGGDDG